MRRKKTTETTQKSAEANNLTEEEKKELFGAEPNAPQIVQTNTEKQQKQSMEELDITDGKYRDQKEEQIAKARELEDLLGIHQMNPYRTLNKDIFEQKLEEMSISDMTSLAMHVGVTPTQSASQLKKDLKASFDTYARRHNVTVPSAAKPIIDENSPNYKKTVKLFKDI